MTRSNGSRGRYSRGNANDDSPLGHRLLLGVALLATIGFVTFVIINDPPDTDLATNCPIDQSKTKGSIFVLLDATEELSATQQDFIKDTVYSVVNAARKYDRISIFEVRPSRDEVLSPLFNYCKPSKNALGSPIVQLFEEQQFKTNLQDYFDSIDYELPASPIIQAIGSVATNFPANGSRKHLIIASDFIEYSELLNQYDPAWESAYQQNSKLVRDAAPILDRVELAMLFIPRPKVSHHDKQFAGWWRRFLSESGARITEQSFENDETGQRFELDPFIPVTG